AHSSAATTTSTGAHCQRGAAREAEHDPDDNAAHENERDVSACPGHVPLPRPRLLGGFSPHGFRSITVWQCSAAPRTSARGYRANGPVTARQRTFASVASRFSNAQVQSRQRGGPAWEMRNGRRTSFAELRFASDGSSTTSR